MSGAYGSLGNIYSLFGSGQELPDWLKKQAQAFSESQQLVDQNGRPFIQLGETPEEINKKRENGTYLDPSKIRYDPELGYITDPENFKGADPTPFYKDPMFWGFAGLTGLGLGAQGLLGGFGAEGGLGESGAFDMGGSTGFGGSTPLASGPADSYWGALADSGQVASDAGGGLFDTMPSFQPEPSFMPEMSQSPFSAADSLPGMGGGQQSWAQRILGPLSDPSNLPAWIAEHPLEALRAGIGAGSIISALGGGGNSSGGGNGQGIPWQNGQMPSFNPSMQPFQQNPYLNVRVPFMSGG